MRVATFLRARVVHCDIGRLAVLKVVSARFELLQLVPVWQPT
jgi:hypothetical protein